MSVFVYVGNQEMEFFISLLLEVHGEAQANSDEENKLCKEFFGSGLHGSFFCQVCKKGSKSM